MPMEWDQRVRSRDLRMVPIAVTAWAVALVVVFSPGAAVWVVACVCTCAVGIGSLLVVSRGRRRAERSRVASVGGLVLVGAAVAGAVAATALLAAPVREAAGGLEGRAVSGEVVVVSSPSNGADGRLWFDAETSSIGSPGAPRPWRVPVRVGLAGDGAAAVEPGMRIRVVAEAKAADPGERAVLVLFVRARAEIVSEGDPIARAASGVRRAFVERALTLPAPGSGLLPGLAVGDTRAVDDDLDEAMVASGLSHLTAVSGSNCALVTAAAFWLVALLGGGRALRVVGAGIALSCFVVLVTPEPSVVRAATMSGLAMTCLLLGRPRAGLPVLLLAVTVLLVTDPWLGASPGFALSAVATGGLIVLAPPLARGLRRWMPGGIALVLAVPLSAQLVCGPIIALFADRQSLVGVIANLLAEPAAPVATILGMLACLAMPVPPLADLLVACAWLPSAWIAATAQTTAALPLATVGIPAGLLAAVVVAVLSIATAWLLIPHRPGGRRRATITLAAGIVVSTALGLGGAWAALDGPMAPLTRPGDWSIAACDIGQGDASLSGLHLRESPRAGVADGG
ncbi:ComEC/Rec2-related protein [Microbacterium resistens]|uniref:ComEC/Rec2-related protein n=1 Tax=Microbacterium resistens TaxID=156977 RepID=A0ABU1SGM7_9MICO|nr:ComEC/Rec2 family competence protein [Microbacterium resistens]MDR6868769.1 ComEC/Rec2-related protein [Microbacterium resistens]